MTARRRAPAARDGPAFNHAMLYVRSLDRALQFYVDGLGFRLVDELEGYGRLRAARGDSTIALHLTESRARPSSSTIRLYFEVADIERYCARLEAKGIRFTAPVERKSWGWKHAYLTDPDGHELSIYSAGAARLRRRRIPKTD